MAGVTMPIPFDGPTFGKWVAGVWRALDLAIRALLARGSQNVWKQMHRRDRFGSRWDDEA